MNSKTRSILWSCLAMVWVVAFGTSLIQTNQTVRRLRRAQDQLNRLSAEHSRLARDVRSAFLEKQARHQEMEFLQSLVNVLPQEKGFARTQRAMAREVDSLRAKVGRKIGSALHVLVDTQANKLYVKRGLTLEWQADCSAGRGGVLIDKATGRRWEFVTPRGVFTVLDKVEKPVWTKPDWAFVEAGETVPPPADPVRRAEGELGRYVLNLGDGYLIHGTKNEALLGRPASHGCVRLGEADLERLYQEVPRGTRVYIY